MGVSDQAVATGLAAGTVGVMGVLTLAVVVLLIVARWKIFTKAGEAGWKSIIPVYSDYVEWRIGWKKTSMFWVSIVLAMVGLVAMSAGGFPVESMYSASSASVDYAGMNMGLVSAGGLAVLAASAISLVADYKLFKSFGHGAGWFVLYLLFPSIMLLVLGFGSSRHVGAQD